MVELVFGDVNFSIIIITRENATIPFFIKRVSFTPHIRMKLI